MSIIKEAVILHIKIAIAIIFVMLNNPEVQEYFHKYFILFSKIIYIIFYVYLLRGKQRSLSTQDFKSNVIS